VCEQQKLEEMSHQDRCNCFDQFSRYLDGVLGSSGELKVLLCDESVMSILSVAYSQHELLQHNVVLVDLLSNSSRFEMKHFTCVILCRPSRSSLSCVFQELAEGNFSSYSVYFTTMASSAVIQSLANADVMNLVEHVEEVYVDSMPITEWVSVSQLPRPVAAPASLDASMCCPLSTSSSQWSSETVSKFSESIVSFLLASNRRPVIRYRAGNSVMQKLAEDLGDRMTGVHSMFPDLPAKESVVLLLDRLDDPITPLLMPWSYEAMIHELIGFQKGNEVIVDSNGENSPSSADDRRHIITPNTDSFFKEHRYDDWGQVCLAVSDMVKAYKEMNQFDRTTVSFDEIKNFITQFPDAKKKSTLVTRHCTIASEMLAEINSRNLTKIAVLEQDIISNHEISEHSRLALEVIQDPKTDVDDALRLAMLYCLRYEKTSGNIQAQLRQELLNRRCASEKVELLDQLIQCAGVGYRQHELFKQTTGHFFKAVSKAVGQFGKEVQNVMTEHTPLLKKILNRAYNGTLDVNRYPVLEASGSPISSSQAPYIKGKDIIVVMVGGVTYAEAMLLANINDRKVDNNLESLMTIGKTVSRKLGGGGVRDGDSAADISSEAPTAKLEACVSLLSTGIINSKEFIRNLH